MTARDLDEVVVGLAGNAADAVPLGHAIALAERADLAVTAVRQVPEGAGGALVHGALDDVERLVEDAGGRVSIRALQGERPADAVVDFVAHRPRSLLVMGTHARPALGQLVLGSVALEVARRAPVPLMLVGPTVAAPGSGSSVEAIAVCTDGSEGAARVVGPATVVARATGWQLSVVRVAPSQQLDAARAAVTAEAAAWWPALDVPVEVVEESNPCAGLVDLTHVRPGTMPAIATHARRVGQRFREGSVAACVARSAVTPVLVVGPAVAP